MKKKYIAMTALTVWLGVSGWLASMVIVKPAVLFIGNNAEESPEAAQLRASINRNRQVLELASRLRPATFMTTHEELIALPSAAEPAAAPVDGSGADTFAAAPAVSMVLVTDGRSSAVVNGQPVRAGSRLDDGSRVLAIGRDWVRVRGVDGETSVLKVRNPVQAGAAQ